MTEVRKAATLCSGIGGVDCGLRGAGLMPVVAVEFDPEEPNLSTRFQEVHTRNFPYGQCRLNTVQEEAANGFANFPDDLYVLHMSPVCRSFSVANRGAREEDENDIEIAEACSKAIALLIPTYITLENVPAYQNSESWDIILQQLQSSGYYIRAAVIDFADYGVPQNRRRFIVLASAPGHKILRFPPQQPRRGWGTVLEGMSEDQFELVEPLEVQLKGLQEHLIIHASEKLLVERYGATSNGRLPMVRDFHQPCWTLTRNLFTDGKDSGRKIAINYWDGHTQLKALNIRAVARLGGFPDWYTLPNNWSTAGQGIGYSVPPSFVKLLFDWHLRT